MVNPYHHAVSSVRRWGGKWQDYIAIHAWFDESKSHFADIRHRALRHHSEGIFLMESIFGPTLTNSDGRVIPTRYVGEQHVKEDLGWIPTVKDWLQHMDVQPWMRKVAVKEKDLATDNNTHSTSQNPPPETFGRSVHEHERC